MDIVRQLLAILLVFALLWAALYSLRRSGKGRKPGWIAMKRTKSASGLLESQGKLALTPRHSIHLIRIGDRHLILALHPDGVTFLGDIQPAAGGRRSEMAAP